jgi:hypothetical protein
VELLADIGRITRDGFYEAVELYFSPLRQGWTLLRTARAKASKRQDKELSALEAMASEQLMQTRILSQQLDALKQEVARYSRRSPSLKTSRGLFSDDADRYLSDLIEHLSSSEQHSALRSVRPEAHLWIAHSFKDLLLDLSTEQLREPELEHSIGEVRRWLVRKNPATEGVVLATIGAYLEVAAFLLQRGHRQAAEAVLTRALRFSHEAGITALR